MMCPSIGEGPTFPPPLLHASADNSLLLGEASEIGVTAAATAAAIKGLMLRQQQSASETAGNIVSGVAASADTSFLQVCVGHYQVCGLELKHYRSNTEST